MAQQALVLYCVQYDQQAQACTQQAWLPAPSLLPPLSTGQAGQLLSVIALVYAACWGWKKLGHFSTK